MALVWGGVISVQAQDGISAKFCSPFDFPLLLSANFGELRPNHFHNGLDIKTQGVVGKPIHSIAEDMYRVFLCCMVATVRRCSSLIPTDILRYTDMWCHSLRRSRNISASISMSTKHLCAMCVRK